MPALCCGPIGCKLDTSSFALRREYEELTRSGVALTADQQWSSRYARAEQNLVDGVRIEDPAVRVVAWVTRLIEVEEFRSRHSRMPRENNRVAIPDDERHLADWIRRNRSRGRDGKLTDYQRRRLDLFPRLVWNPYDKAWEQSFVLYERFILLNGAAPKYRTAKADERSLANWAAKQRARKREGRLNESRQRELERLSIWTWG